MTHTPFTLGQRVHCTSPALPIAGTVSGAPYGDSLPTGAVFVPVTTDEGHTHNVDSRVLTASAVA